MLASIPQSSWVGGSFDLVVNGFAKNVLVLLAASISVVSWRRLRQSVTVQTIIVIVLAAVSLKGNAQNGRQYGAGNMFSDPNDFALNAVMVLPFAVFGLRNSSRLWKRACWLLGAALLVAMIVLSGSRGGFIALCVSALLLTWKLKSRKSVAFGLCAIAVVLLLCVPSYRERMTTIFDTDRDKVGSAQARKELLKRSLEVTSHRPILGVGPGQFQEASGAWHETHNTFTQLSAECGIPALFVFLMMARSAVSNLRKGMSNIDQSSSEYILCWSILCSVIGYLVGGFFLSTTYWLAPYVLFIYAAAAGSLATSGVPRS
jgi:O-antigen ligase